MKERTASDPTSYAIIEAGSAKELKDMLNEIINGGQYVPIGGISLAVLPDGGRLYAQAVVASLHKRAALSNSHLPMSTPVDPS